MARVYQSFKEFYPYYLTEHSLPSTRRLHFIGTTLFFVLLITGIIRGKWYYFALLPIMGYGFAWVGHFFYEKNKPATFTYPLWSLLSDFKMYFDWLGGSLNRKLEAALRDKQHAS
jgi:hypothetical protein